ncbi:MAG TPA: c-type cytochrome [Bradyrhizobium sp.]|jgi:cytochrome c2|nr:c-type cytochrome [Bradyrhizobium sp.]
MQLALTRYRWRLAGAVAVLIAAVAGAASLWQMQDRSSSTAVAMTGGDIARAPELIRRYGCAGCHTIPGIPGGDGKVGGPLKDIRQRVYVGGVVTNAPDNLVRWIVSPQTFSPRTAMPATGISETEARDVAAYLYSR